MGWPGCVERTRARSPGEAMNRRRPRVTHLALVLTLASATTIAAGLKDKPPEGVKLAGTEWQLDPYHSDDGGEALDRAARKAAQPDMPRTTSGGIFGDDGSAG